MASRASTSSAPISLALLADPPIKLVDGASFDYFIIEMVATLRESAAFATARNKKTELLMAEAGLIIVPTPTTTTTIKKDGGGGPGPRDSVTSLHSNRPKSTIVDEEDEPLRVRLEAIGMHVGANFAERLCAHRAPFVETLDVIKFICKDVWTALFDKQVDNLRTNHRGVYVLQDNHFKPIQRLSSFQGRADAVKKAKIYALLPAGIIRGTMTRLGYSATVTPEISSMPQCTFQVKLPKNA